MELQFQEQPQQQNLVTKGSRFKGRSRSSSNTNRFVGVRQRPSGRWVAEIKGTTQNIRMWLGTFETAEEAAQAYDEAACLLRGSNTRTNFITHVPSNSPLASRIRNLLDGKMPVKQKHLPASNTSTGASTSSFPLSNDMNAESQVTDDDYKPNISNFSEGFELGSSRSDPSWVLEPGFEWYPFEHDRNHPFLPENIVSDIEELEQTKVETGALASRHPINGVHEYLETVHDPVDALWDLPPLCKSFCHT